MKTTSDITPTKERPIFIADCDWFGYIDGIYKGYAVSDPDGGTTGGSTTFALSYVDAITKLHEWIKENNDVLNEYPKCKFSIYVVNGE